MSRWNMTRNIAGKVVPDFPPDASRECGRCADVRPKSFAHPDNEKRRRTTAVQDAGATARGSRPARSVLACASPLAFVFCRPRRAGALRTFRGLIALKPVKSPAGAPGGGCHPEFRVCHHGLKRGGTVRGPGPGQIGRFEQRSEEHTSELQSHSFISYA